MDPESITENTFKIISNAGFNVNGTVSYVEALNCAYFNPYRELGGLTTFTGYIGSDIRSVYGRILPKMDPYTWKFTTARGQARVWEEISYNGEKYYIFLLWGPGYAGGTPAYLGSPAYLASVYGNLLEIQVVKYVNGKYYDVPDPEIRNTVFLGALRKSYYSYLNSSDLKLIEQAQVDYVTGAASSLIADLAYYSWLIATFGTIPRTPDGDDVIRASIARALGSEIDRLHVPGYFNTLLTWFSTGLTGAATVNDAYIKINKMMGSLPTGTEKNALSDVLRVLNVLDRNLKFQKDMVEYIFTLMWQLEVANTYRPQIMIIRDYTSGDTREALTQLLTWNRDSIMSEVSGLILNHYLDQGLILLKEQVHNVLMKTPAMPAVIIMKVLESVVSYLKVFEFRSQAWTATYLADANSQFTWARQALLDSLKYYSGKTPWDYALISMTSGLCYSTAADFYDTRTEMVRILRRWPSLITGTNSGQLESLENLYMGLAGTYRGHASNIIPELDGSNRDLSLLLPLLKSPSTGTPTYIHIGAFSPVTLLVTAPDGRRIGYDHVTGTIINEFGDDAFYNSPYSEPQAILLPVMSGEFRIRLYGVDTGVYRVILEVLDENMQPVSESEWRGDAVPGLMKSFSCFVDEFGSAFRYDSKPPVIMVSGVRYGGVYRGAVKPRITVIDDNLESWIATINGELYTGGPLRMPGTYYLIVRASDGVNIVYSLVVFTINATRTPEKGDETGTGVKIQKTVQAVMAPLTGVEMEPVINETEQERAVDMVPPWEGYDYTWILVSLLVSVIIIGVYSSLRRRG